MDAVLAEQMDLLQFEQLMRDRVDVVADSTSEDSTSESRGDKGPSGAVQKQLKKINLQKLPRYFS